MFEYDNQDHTSVFHLKDQNIQREFIAKVFGTVFLQVLFTILVVSLCFISPSLGYLATNLSLLWAIVGAGTMLGLSLSTTLARTVPLNYALMALFTLCQSFFVFTVIEYVALQILLTAGLYLTVILGLLTVYSFTTSTDFTNPMFNLKFLMLQLLLSVVLFFFRIDNYIYVVISTLVFSMYLIVDLQLISGKKDVKLGVDDYMVGAIMIYTDVIHLFLYIVQLLDKGEDKKKKK